MFNKEIMTVWEKIHQDPKVAKVENRLQRIAVLMINTDLMMGDGTLSAEAGQKRLARLKAMREEVKELPGYRR